MEHLTRSRAMLGADTLTWPCVAPLNNKPLEYVL